MDRPGTNAEGTPGQAADSQPPDSRFTEGSDIRSGPALWLQWRIRLIVLAALLGCVGQFALVRHVMSTPALDASWAPDHRGEVVLVASPLPSLHAMAGHALQAITGVDDNTFAIDAAILRRAPRWIVDDSERARVVAMRLAVGRALADGPVRLDFARAMPLTITAVPRGFDGMGLPFWPIAVLAFATYLVGVVVCILRPRTMNVLFLLVTTCQSANLLFIAFDTVPGLAFPGLAVAHDPWLRMALDVVTAASMLHAFTLHPARLPHGRAIALGGWAFAGIALAAIGLPVVSHAWWWSQAAILALGLACVIALIVSARLHPNPLTTTLRRFGYVTVGSMALLTVALAGAGRVSWFLIPAAEVGSAVWYVFLASQLLLVPFLSRSHQLLREFVLLAGIGAVTASLNLLFLTALEWSRLASLTAAVALSSVIYAAVRPWILNQLAGSGVLTLERSFEKLYRVAREVESHPERHASQLLALLRDLYEPLETHRVHRRLAQSRAVSDGSALLVPVPRASAADRTEADAPEQTWVLRHAHRGKRLFTADDARLADRMCEQLRRAVAYDQAVERGRREERQRIAQDLHDDIGARLLTLMYRANSPEMEDYARHTLQDLKTITRGLAASEHRLSHAIAEWKADIGQRLAAAQIALDWTFDYDHDIALTISQWSGLTRVLRELVSNVIAHAKASRLQVEAVLKSGRLTLRVSDDGCGRDPSRWTRGLGLGGVHKRVKLLGGSVQWRENGARGIVCEAMFDGFESRRSPQPS